MLHGALYHDDIAGLDKHHSVAARTVGDEHRMMCILRKENHLAGAMWCHTSH